MPRPYFHKLILSKTIQEKKLRIPDNFNKKYGKDLTTFVRVTIPGGHLWRIGLLKVDDKIWFHDHWQEFVERYAIRVGHFLVFKYEGNAVFHVHIFDLSASEINYQAGGFSGLRSFIFEDMDDDDYVGHMVSPATQNLFNDPKPLNSISWAGEQNLHLPKSASVSHSTNQLIRDGGHQNSWMNSVDDVKYFGLDGETPKPKKRGRKKKKVDPAEQEMPPHNEEDSDGRFRFYESASVRKRTVTAEERERAVSASKAFEPVNPFCRVVLRPSYLYRGCIMYLPSGFAEKHLNGVSGFIRLQHGEKQWPVRCLYRGGRAKLSQGWYEFAAENNMGEGDVCVFELMKSRDVVLKVTVFRVIEGYMNLP